MNKSGGRNTIQDRRAFVKNALMLAGLGAGAAVLPNGVRTGSTMLAQAARGARGVGAAQTGSTLILLGTQGGPNVNLVRGETASAVMVNGQPYLVDCGYGTLRALVQAGISFNNIANIFITHLHDDHTADVAALLSHKWTGGNATPQPAIVRGPYGTAAMVEGAIAFFKANTEIRMVDEGRTVKPESIFSGKDLSAPKLTEVFRDDRVTVQAIENAHFPDRAKEKMLYRSFAYRFNMADRSIVFSGDTAYSAGLIELAKGADVLVCEAMSMASRQQFEAAPNPANGESIGRHVLETHSSTEEVGRMASAARVKTVVLNHLVPGGNSQRGPLPAADVYSADVRKYFDGEVIVGADQMRI